MLFSSSFVTRFDLAEMAAISVRHPPLTPFCLSFYLRTSFKWLSCPLHHPSPLSDYFGLQKNIKLRILLYCIHTTASPHVLSSNVALPQWKKVSAAEGM